MEYVIALGKYVIAMGKYVIAMGKWIIDVIMNIRALFVYIFPFLISITAISSYNLTL